MGVVPLLIFFHEASINTFLDLALDFFNLFLRSGPGTEAGSDPRGHLWVTWGVYLCAGKPPLADIILSHPTDLT